MHYKDGKEAKVGDVVKFPRWTPNGTVQDAGTLVHAQPGSTTCNGQVHRVRFHQPDDASGVPLVDTYNHCVTIGECELLHRIE